MSTNPTGNISVCAQLRGQVQGVGFRFFAKNTAISYGINDYVKNNLDGSVEAVLEGPRNSVLRVVEVLKSKFHVEHIDLSDSVPRGFHSFRIARD